MIPGLTQALDIYLDDTSLDLSGAEDILVTINQNGEVSNFSGDRVEVNSEAGYILTIYLTQQETLRFRFGPATAMINWVVSDGAGGVSRLATEPFVIEIGQQLFRSVMTE